MHGTALSCSAGPTSRGALLQGVIVIPNVLPQSLVQHMNSVIDGACADGIIDDERRSDRFNFAKVAALDPSFLETMASPTTLEVIRVMCGDWLRLDHACAFRPTPPYAYVWVARRLDGATARTRTLADGIHMDRSWSGRQNLHGGNRMATGEHQYQWFQGRMYNGLLVVMYALEDVNPGDGGFICVPGQSRRALLMPLPSPTVSARLMLPPHSHTYSRACGLATPLMSYVGCGTGTHKANLPYRPTFDSHLVLNPTMKAGDMLIFTCVRSFARHPSGHTPGACLHRSVSLLLA